MGSLTDLGSALATYGGLSYLVSDYFELYELFPYNSIFLMRDVLFMYTIIHNYSMEGYTPIFISSFMQFSLFSSLYFPVYACENY